MKERIIYIDVAKGFAIILVVMGHVLCYDLYGFENCNDSKLFGFICSFHMPLFFFLSGLVSKTDLKWEEMPKDLWKRFRSLMVPFFVIGGVFSLWNAGNLGFIFHSAKWGYWYLWVLFVFYVISYPISKMGKGKVGLIIQIVVSLVVWYALLKLFENASAKMIETLSIYRIFYNFPFFIMGMLVKQYDLQGLIFENVYVFASVIILWMFSKYLVFPFAEFVIATAAIIVVVNCCRKFCEAKQSTFKNGILCLGRSSLFVYVFHFFFVELLMTDYLRDWLVKYSNFGIDVLLTIIPTVVIIIGSLAVKFVLERESLIMKLVFNKHS